MAVASAADRKLVSNDMWQTPCSRFSGFQSEPALQSVPQGYEAVRFGDQEGDDESAENDALAHVENSRIEDVSEQESAGARQDERKDDDQRGAEERAPDRRQPADDDDEKDLERAVAIESRRFDGAQIGEGPQNTGNPDNEGGDPEGEELGLEHGHADDASGDLIVADGDEVAPAR